MRPGARVALALALCLGSGCRSPRGTFALAAPEAPPGTIATVRETVVAGEACVTGSFLVFDLPAARAMYREAARQALAQVPGANALRDARFWFLRTPFWVYCAHVEGVPVALR